MIRYARFDTDLGAVFAAAAGPSLVGLWFVGGRHAPLIADDWVEDSGAAPLAAPVVILRSRSTA